MTGDGARPSSFALTVDTVAVGFDGRGLRVLLVRRGRAPHRGFWALPGGFVDPDETLEEAARRELSEETGLGVGRLRQLGAWGDPGRDPRGRTVSVVFLAETRLGDAAPEAGDDAAEAAWHSLVRPPELAFDHRDILRAARRRLAAAASGSPRGSDMLPDLFPHARLDALYRALLGRTPERPVAESFLEIGLVCPDSGLLRFEPRTLRRLRRAGLPFRL